MMMISLIIGNGFANMKVGLPPSKKKIFICFNDSPTKIINVFLFHIKSSFRSQDISIFVLIFSARRRNSLKRKIGLISKFMSQAD